MSEEMNVMQNVVSTARLIVKLTNEKAALEREVADLKERNEFMIANGHVLIDGKTALEAAKESAEHEVARLKAELEEAMKANDIFRIEMNEFSEALRNISVTLCGSDEWDNEDDMRWSVQETAKAAQHEIERLKANDWGPLNLRVQQLERERNEFQGALLRVKFALGWPSDAVEMNEDIIQYMIRNARYHLAKKNDLESKLRQIEEIVNGSDS